MVKVWFINSQGHHKGPYTKKEVLKLKSSGQIDKYTLLWKKGLEKWKPFFELEANYFTKLQEPGLPPLPGLPELPSLPSLPTEEKLPEVPKEKSESSLPPVPENLESLEESIVEDSYTHEEIDPYGKIDEVDRPEVDQEDEEDEYEDYENYDDEEYDDEPREFPIISTLVASIFIVTVLIFTFFLVKEESSYKFTFKNISIKTLERLNKVKNDSKFYINFGVDKNSQTIYGKTNLRHKAQFRANFESIEEDKVSFSSSAISKNGNLVFENLSFEKGEKFIQGKYKVKVEATIKDEASKLKNFFLNRPQKFVYNDVLLLIPGSKKEYLKKKSEIKTNKKLEIKDDLLLLDQKIQTLDSFITSISLQYRISLGSKTGSEGKKVFTRKYTTQVGPLLQTMILSDYENFLEKLKADPEVLKMAREFHDLSKEVAGWSAVLSKDIGMYGKLNKKKREYLKNLMNKKKEVYKYKVQILKNSVNSKVKSL